MLQSENPGRERILQRIRTALANASPASHIQPAPQSGPIFARVEDPLDRFQKECAANTTECIITPNMDSSSAALCSLVSSLPPGEVFLQDTPELRKISSVWSGGRQVRWSSTGRPDEASVATITLAELLVAETGSVMVSAACGGRAATVTAPVHIVVTKLSQLVPSLEAGFARLRERGTVTANSMVCMISGPSRTADIEKILVLGAHGPRRLVVLLSLKD